jgi:hypothetical protein
MAALLDVGTVDRSRCPRTLASGKQCGNQAGKNTPHPGHGYCYKHGGTTPNGQKHGAKLMAVAAMRESTGEVDVNPLDALLYTVRRASHLAAYYRLQAEALELEGRDARVHLDLERQALGDLNAWADRAIKAGVAERMVRIAENTGERLASALEDALEGVELGPDVRRQIVQRFGASLARLEREQPAITVRGTDV